jgi:hypothetical protein
MSNTPTLSLPLVQPSQAQKHVTVNEALSRLDAMVQLRLRSRNLTTPPTGASEGDAYAVASGAGSEWAGRDGQIALFLNGGWDFIPAGVGWRAWVEDEGMPLTCDGVDWVPGVGALSTNGAGTALRVIEFDHVLGAGPTSDTGPVIPAQCLVMGVTGIVLQGFTGAATTWRIGIAGVSDDRYGSGLGLATGSWLRGLTAQPLTYYADTALTLTGEGGDFASGSVRLAIHVAELGLPRL